MVAVIDLTGDAASAGSSSVSVPPPPPPAGQPQRKTPPNFEDALNALPELQQQLKAEDAGPLSGLLPKLVEGTVQWKHTPIRSYRWALQCSEIKNHRLYGRDLQQEFHDLILVLTRILTRHISVDSSAEWAIRSLVMLVDNDEKLYDNRVYFQNQQSRYPVQEGAKHLMGLAAKVFKMEGGYETLKKAIGKVEVGPLDALVQVWAKLAEWQELEVESPNDFCLAAADAILKMSDTDLVGSRDHLQNALENLLSLTDAAVEADDFEVRARVESAWWRFVSTGICSQNLLARRGAAEELGAARRRGISPSSLTKWLAEDRIFEELFGPRSDSRVIEDMNLEALCEPTVDGLRALLQGLRPALGQDVLYKKLHQLALRSPHWKPDKWGCDLIVVELMRWARSLLEEGSAHAVPFITGFISQTTGTKDHKKKRVFSFILDDAVTEVVLTLVEAMLAPAVTDEQLVHLEAAYDDSKNDCTGDRCRWKIIERMMPEVEECIEAIEAANNTPASVKPVRRQVLRMFLRLLQSCPFEVEDQSSGTCSREAFVTYLEEESPAFSEKLWTELCWFLKQAPGPDYIVDVQIRLRLFCYLYRCSPNLEISEDQLKEMIAVLRAATEGATHVCYLLRISSTAPPHIPEEQRSFPALSRKALVASLRFLEEWAVERGGLDLPGFYCLAQAMVLVNAFSPRCLLCVENGSGRRAGPQRIAANLSVQSGDSSDIKVRDEQRVGMWAKVLQDHEENWKIGRLGMFNAVDQTYTIEYIDEATHSSTNLRSVGWKPLPSLLEQKVAIPTVHSVRNPEELAGLRGLWACALSASEKGGIAPLASDFILALHAGTNGAKALLSHLRKELESPTTATATSRCLALLNTLVTQQPPSRVRNHIGPGFPMRVTVWEYRWVKAERWVKHWEGNHEVWKQEHPMIRQQHGGLIFDIRQNVHSNMTILELHTVAATHFGRRAVRLRERGGRRLVQNSLQTLEEFGIAPNAEFEADEDEPVQEYVDGPLDGLGEEGGWNELLLSILARVDSNISEADRSLCWRLLLRLPTWDSLKEMVRTPARLNAQKWQELLSKDSFWQSAYAVLLVEAYAPQQQLRRHSQTDKHNPTVWLQLFERKGGAAALLKLLFEACKSDSGLGALELSSMLPSLVRAVGVCVIGVTNGEGGFGESLSHESCCELLSAAAFATRWLFKTSQACDDLWQRLRLRHAAADSLELLVEVERRGEPPLEMLDEKVLPLLVEIISMLEGPTNARVEAAVVALARRPACAQRLLQRFAVELPKAAAPLEKSTVFVDALCDIIGQVVSTLDPSAAQPERAALLEAVVRSVLSCKVEVAGLYRLLAIDVAGVSALEEGALQRLIERLLKCLLPENLGEIGSEATREAGAQVLIQLLPASTWKLRLFTLRKVFSYMAGVQAPEGWNFEPTVPEEPYTLESCRRNATGYAGLVNRGMTCYMNSTLQQLFWAQPFRRAILSSPPPLPSEAEKPEPLPESVSASATASRGLTINIEEEKEKPKSTPFDVGWQTQRLFSYLQDCQLGLYNTDQLVDSCSNLNLEYNVKSMNDAPEFFDKLLDKIDEVCESCGDPPQKPSSVFQVKTERQKHCHHCGLRTKAPSDTMCRVQVNELYPTLEECLQKITEAEMMMGDNRVDCESCKQKRDTSYQTYFAQLPQVLVFHLGRMQFNYETLEREKRNDRIVFPVKLSMAKYTEDAVLNGQESVQGCTYELQGVQVHQGTAHAGHYYSFSQDAQGKWFKFNDDRVSPFDLEDLDEECFGGEGHGRFRALKSHNAYMLYYRCVEATPYCAQAASRTHVVPKAPNLQRSKSEKLDDDFPAPPALVRTTTQAVVSGEQLQHLMKHRRQSQMAASLKEEILSINEQLHRHAVVFSPVTLRFLLKFAGQLCTVLAEVASNSETSEDADIPAGDRKAHAEEGLCRLTAKVLFDVVLHAKGMGSEQLEPWVNLFTQQFAITGSSAPGWLAARLSGLPDEVLGRRSSGWLAKALVGPGLVAARLPACRGVVKIAVAAAEAIATGDEGAIRCQSFLAALIMLMGSIESGNAIRVYGELWYSLLKSTILLPVLVQYRASGDLSATSLLLHAFCGCGSTPLDSPPAPPLPTGRSELVPAFMTQALLCAVAVLLNQRGPDQDESLTPFVESPLFWRALAVRNPNVFEADTPYRRLFPESIQVQVTVGRALIERLRPTGLENVERSERLQGALKFVLLAGDEHSINAKLGTLCQVGRDLAASSEEMARRRPWSYNYNHVQEKNPGPRNPDAVQLLRILQVVSSLELPLAETWSWARDWLMEVCSRKERRKWEDQGLDILEVEKVRTSLKGPGGEALPEEPELLASDVFITVSGAGMLMANGRYFFRFEDKFCAFFQHEENGDLTLYQQENNHRETTWVITNGTEGVLYQTHWTWSESPLPPSSPHEWHATRRGVDPSPTLEVTPLSTLPRNQESSGNSANASAASTTEFDDDLYDDAPIGNRSNVNDDFVNSPTGPPTDDDFVEDLDREDCRTEEKSSPESPGHNEKQNSSSDDWAAPTRPPDDGSSSWGASPGDGCNWSSGDNDSATPGSVSAQDGWACTACTLLNSDSAAWCRVCRTPRQQANSQASSGTGGYPNGGVNSSITRSEPPLL